MELAELARLLASPLHEARLLALLLLARRFAAATAASQRDLYHFYFGHIGHINIWDLVDASAPPLVGGYLSGRSRRPLYQLAASASLWERRIAIVATLHFIRNRDFADTLRIVEQLLDDREDLLHKACGWMLREVGKRDLAVAEGFILRHGRRMPRTMLRYLLECFPEAARRRHLRKTVAVAAGSARPARKRRNVRYPGRPPRPLRACHQCRALSQLLSGPRPGRDSDGRRWSYPAASRRRAATFRDARRNSWPIRDRVRRQQKVRCDTSPREPIAVQSSCIVERVRDLNLASYWLGCFADKRRRRAFSFYRWWSRRSAQRLAEDKAMAVRRGYAELSHAPRFIGDVLKDQDAIVFVFVIELFDFCDIDIGEPGMIAEAGCGVAHRDSGPA